MTRPKAAHTHARVRPQQRGTEGARSAMICGALMAKGAGATQIEAQMVG
jgi:hypothetical protein